MTKPPKPGSLRAIVEDKIKGVPGYKNLDKELRTIREGERADYIAFDRRMVIEQKEQQNMPEHRANGRALEDLAAALEVKYKMSMFDIAMASPPIAVTSEEAALLRKLKDKFYDKQKDNAHKANNQIASTKRILSLPNAVGVLLLIFDQVPGMMPEIINQRATRDLHAMEGNEPKFKHIDIIMFFSV